MDIKQWVDKLMMEIGNEKSLPEDRIFAETLIRNVLEQERDETAKLIYDAKSITMRLAQIDVYPALATLVLARNLQ